MSDLISREALIEEIKQRAGMWQKTAEKFISVIKEQPTVEAVPGVVRCKNCTHWGTGVAGETEHVKCCEYGKYMVGKNGYCVYGEKV